MWGAPSFSTIAQEKDDASELVTGHRLIRKGFDWDETKPMGKGNIPHMFICSHCFHTRQALKNYRRVKDPKNIDEQGTPETPEQRYKHVIDDIRYYYAMKPYFDRMSYGHAHYAENELFPEERTHSEFAV